MCVILTLNKNACTEESCAAFKKAELRFLLPTLSEAAAKNK